ncbi:AAA family ATPase, partial [Helicobacter equorum]|uniref:AAA family ATPase n=1 Tax=Helicobacter equorum TaxID=361872 RepID=UPI002D78E143
MLSKDKYMRLPYLVVVGSHTDVGKSAVSAALCYGLGLAYHKIVQAGTPTDSDV